MDHLACFVPGMLALGSAHGAVTGARAQQYTDLAENMTATCYQMYARQPTGAPHGTTSPRPLSNAAPPPPRRLLRMRPTLDSALHLVGHAISDDEGSLVEAVALIWRLFRGAVANQHLMKLQWSCLGSK